MKRGQAAGAAVLLAIIAGLIIMFIILVNPSDRAELLDLDEDDDTDTSDDEIDEANVEENLLTENPGRIDYLSQREIEHSLPVVNIYTRTDSKVVAEKNSIYAKKSLFSEEIGRFTFPVTDLEHAENLLLAFEVKDIAGNLKISLNGEEVYNGLPAVGNIPPINLPQHLLQEANELAFMLSSPGIAFWSTNKASLSKVKVVGDITDISAQSSSNIFLVSETEKSNLEKVVLRFQPACKFTEVGPLIITVNGRELYNAVPDCDLEMIPIEFSPDLVHIGENELVFRATKGTYVLSHVQIKSELEEVDFPTYYFDLSEEDYQDLQSDDLRLRLSLEFVDVVSSKYGDVVFNGHLLHFDTKEVSLTIDLGEDIERGSNSLKLKPRKTLEVRELKVDLVE